MNATIYVLDSMVYDLMGVLPSKALVREQKIGIESRSRLNMLLHLGLQRVLLAVRNYRGDDLTATLKDAHNGNLVLRAGAGNATGFLGNVHVPGLAADEGFVCLNLAGELDAGILMHDLTDAVKHEPCRLLSDADAAVHLVARDAILASANHPDSHHPLIEPQGGILENGSDFDAELLLASVAHPDTPSLDEGMLLRPATWASNLTVWEPKVERVLESTVRIAEVNDSFLQCVRGFHDSILGRINRCVKYVIALFSSGYTVGSFSGQELACSACAGASVIPQRKYQPMPNGPTLFTRLRKGDLFKQNGAEFLAHNARRYGDLVHFRAAGRDVFQVNHPDLVGEMLVRDAAKHHRGIVMQRARFVLGEGLLTSEEPLHMRQRRLSQPAFHRDRIAGYGEIIGAYASRTAEKWTDGATVDVHDEMLLLALRIVGKCLFDAEVDTEVKQIARAVDAFMGFLPLAFLPFTETLLKLPLPLMKRIRAGERELNTLIYAMIHERRKNPGDRGDLLSMLLEAVDTEEDTGGMSDRQVRDECLTVLLAGHETTANALSFSLWLLATHPEVQERLHAEARSTLGSRPPTAADYAQLPYAHMVFSEAMRLYPPVWVTARTAAIEYEFHNLRIRKGSLLIAPQIVIHHDPRFYADPERFDPERFASGLKSERPRFAYFPFGAGSRQCIGEGLAWMEGILTLATVARDWQLTPPHGASVLLAVKPRISLRPANGVPLVVKRR